ncbi:MAG: zinc-ribbon domain-containing protein, partial [Gemmataceae bacterium]|nr:zinc-ribbon domain-containing protein [Gemmataceae bacterium]
MPIPVQCRECSARLNAPDAAAGKKVKCPKCGSPLTVPAAEPEPEFEEVDEPDAADEPAPKPKKKTAKAAVADDEDDRPKKSKKDRDDEDEDDRPRPKKKGAKGKKKAKSGGGMVFALVGVVLLVVVGGGLAYWFTRPKAPEVAQGGGGDGTGGENKPGPDGRPKTDGQPNPGQNPNLKVLKPLTQFKPDFKPDPKDVLSNQISTLFVTDEGQMIVSNSSSRPNCQSWSTKGELKKLWTREGQVTDLAWIDLATGNPTKQRRPILTVDLYSVSTATEAFTWFPSGDMSKETRFQIKHFQQLPDGTSKFVSALDAGDDSSIERAPPIKQGREFVFGLPRQNKVRVFDFEKKTVVR